MGEGVLPEGGLVLLGPYTKQVDIIVPSERLNEQLSILFSLVTVMLLRVIPLDFLCDNVNPS